MPRAAQDVISLFATIIQNNSRFTLECTLFSPITDNNNAIVVLAQLRG
jgi:hypothetical protein